jgi:flagellin-like protein
MKMESEPCKRRLGVSEVVATVMTMALTLVAGFAVFGYVNGQAGVTERAYGQAVGATVQYLEERFVVTQFAFSSSPTVLTVYVYNNGQISLQIVQVAVYDSSKSSIDVLFSGTGATDLLHSGCSVSTLSSVESPPLAAGSVSSFTLTIPTQSMNSKCPASPAWASGTAYYAQITALYGNQVVYYQVD